MPLEDKRFAKVGKLGDKDEFKEGTGKLDLSIDYEHGEIFDPSLGRRSQPVTDIAIFVGTGADTVLNLDATGRVTYLSPRWLRYCARTCAIQGASPADRDSLCIAC